MFPVRDHNPSTGQPYVTYGLLAANILIFLSYWPFLGSAQAQYGFFVTWGMLPAEISTGRDLSTILTAMFLHGGWMHLIGNMLFLYIFGDNLEEELGHGRFLVFYLACGVVAGLAQVLADPRSAVPMVGASGAVAGVLGGYLLLFPRARVDVLLIFIIFFRIIPVPAWMMLGLWFGLQIFQGWFTGTAGGVAHWAHAGGFAVGLLLMVPVWLARGGPAFWNRTHGVPPHAPASYTRSSVPSVRRR